MPSGNRALNASTAGNGSAEDNQSGGEANQAGGQGNQSGGEEPLSHRDSQPGVPCLVALPLSPRLRLVPGSAPEPQAPPLSPRLRLQALGSIPRPARFHFRWAGRTS